MAEPKPYQPGYDSKPGAPGHPINLRELKDILGKAIKEPDLRRRLFAHPEQTLREMHYEPHPGAVDFINSLKGTSFEHPDTVFHHAATDAQFGMAEA